ncbi:MAG: hypothetical protein WD557_13375, partial [Dehalococcoidia bacterium]
DRGRDLQELNCIHDLSGETEGTVGCVRSGILPEEGWFRERTGPTRQGAQRLSGVGEMSAMDIACQGTSQAR